MIVGLETEKEQRRKSCCWKAEAAVEPGLTPGCPSQLSAGGAALRRHRVPVGDTGARNPAAVSIAGSVPPQPHCY